MSHPKSHQSPVATRTDCGRDFRRPLLPATLIGFMTIALLSLPAGILHAKEMGYDPALATLQPEARPCVGCCCTRAFCGACDDGNPCTDDGCGCPPNVDACACLHFPNDNPNCDDGNACTKIDSCSSGRCTGIPTTGNRCDDNSVCTESDTCSNGTCVGVPIICDDGNICTADSCDPLTGHCVNAPLACDDGNSCTEDSCDPVTGCVHVGFPGEAAHLIFLDAVTLVWNPASFALIHNTYRGTIPGPGSLGVRSPTYDHVCFESDDSQVNGSTLTIDGETPPTGAIFYYLVDGENQSCEGGLGVATDGTPRTPAVWCPTPPP